VKRTLRASAIMGSSSLLSLVFSVLKTKAIAVVLGPEGLGVFGVLQQVLTAGAVVGQGLQGATTREVAAARARDDQPALWELWRTLWWAAPTAAAVMAGWLLYSSAYVADRSLSDRHLQLWVAWMAPGVVASIGAAALTGWLNGYRRTALIARTNVVSSALSAAVAAVAVYLLADLRAVVVTLLAYPLAQLLVGFLAARPDMPGRHSELPKVAVWSPLLLLALSLAATGWVSQITQLVLRGLVVEHLGLSAAGNFQAAFSVSMLYLGFVLSAMATDYYPRLSEAAADRPARHAIVDEQVHVALLLASPVILGMSVAAPLVVQILYSGKFGGANEILRWQLLGDLLKVPSWALGYLVLAEGRTLMFFGLELFWNLAFLGLTWLWLPSMGLGATGVAFVAAYALQLGALMLITGWVPSLKVLRTAAIVALCAVPVFAVHGGWMSIAAQSVVVAGLATFAAKTLWAGFRRGTP